MFKTSFFGHNQPGSESHPTTSEVKDPAVVKTEMCGVVVLSLSTLSGLMKA
jgi:hypothetical protein